MDAKEWAAWSRIVAGMTPAERAALVAMCAALKALREEHNR